MIQSLPALRQQFIAEKKTFYQFKEDDPRRHHPLSLEQLKKQAKELLTKLRKSESWDRLSSAHPAPKDLTPESIKLSDTQWIIAREHGFSSWAKLKHHIEANEIARKAIQTGNPASPDADKRTLHIRCGNDIMYSLAVSGFTGDFLSFADPYIQGPVPSTPSLEAFISVRANFIARNNWRDETRAYDDLSADYLVLEKAADYDRVTFWFEHDAYDVLIFTKLLDFFSNPEKQAPDMQFICVDHYPGVSRFNGIGQLPAETMPVLWGDFEQISEAQYQFGSQCWQAYINNTPEAFLDLGFREDSPLPQIQPALRRHIQELPWTTDGLSLSERLTLKILMEQGPLNAADLFYHWYTTVYEPLAFMGDSSYWLVLDTLAEAGVPAIEIEKASPKPVDWRVSLTSFGQALFDGSEHWAGHNSYDHWFGGVHLNSVERSWYWDNENQAVIQGYSSR